MDQNPTDAPTQRILIIAETIAQYGPLTLAQLTERLRFSRAAIWRAVNTMRAQGWIRMRMGDNAFELRRSFVDTLSRGHASNPATEALEPLISAIQKTGPVYVDVGQFTRPGLCVITESSRKQVQAEKLSLCDDDLAIAAQLSMTPRVLLSHLRAYMESAPDEERRLITSGDHGRHLTRLRASGTVWLADNSAVAFTIPASEGIALRAELWRTTKADIDGFFAQLPPLIATARSIQIDDLATPKIARI